MKSKMSETVRKRIYFFINLHETKLECGTLDNEMRANLFENIAGCVSLSSNEKSGNVGWFAGPWLLVLSCLFLSAALPALPIISLKLKYEKLDCEFVEFSFLFFLFILVMLK